METTLGLLGGGGGGTVLFTGNATKVEKDYLGMSKEAEIELGLGLSLGNGCGAAAAEKEKCGSAWGEYGRILTAKDFPSGFKNTGLNVVSGTKRERAEAGSASVAAAAVSQVVGWPPVRSYRMNTLCNQAKTSNVEEAKGVGGNEKTDKNSNKKMNHGIEKNEDAIKERGHLGFVKVNMDGLPIGRKVDLNAHKSYETLAKTLEEMFFKPSLTILGSCGGKEQLMHSSKLLDGSSEFALTYEDKEGDWMLVGDVPWRMFFSTVKRLRIMRTSEANGLDTTYAHSPKVPGKNDKQNGRAI